MWLIVLLYLLMASTFTLAKISVFYMQPFFFTAFRMIIAGILLLGYLYLFKRKYWRFYKSDFLLLAQIVLFHIYCVYIFEFWAMQFLTSSKACLLYNITPFITALLCYILFKQKISYQKAIALIVGFIGMLPISLADSDAESILPSIGFISTAELALLVSITSGAYGWIVMKQLMDRGYNPIMINGFGMFWGGIAAFLTALTWEGWPPLINVQIPQDVVGLFLFPYLGSIATSIAMVALCLFLLIIIANIVGYNLYGYLLHRYSPTLLSFFGFMTPFFAGIFGIIFLAEPLTMPFFVSLGITTLSLYLFYREEIRIEIKK